MNGPAGTAYAVGFVRVTGLRRRLQQIRAMLVKLILHAVRNYAMSLSQIVTPVFFVACACGIIMTLPKAYDLPPLYLNLSKYRSVVVPYLSAEGVSLGDQLGRIAGNYRDVVVSQVRS